MARKNAVQEVPPLAALWTQWIETGRKLAAEEKHSDKHQFRVGDWINEGLKPETFQRTGKKRADVYAEASQLFNTPPATLRTVASVAKLTGISLRNEFPTLRYNHFALAASIKDPTVKNSVLKMAVEKEMTIVDFAAAVKATKPYRNTSGDLVSIPVRVKQSTARILKQIAEARNTKLAQAVGASVDLWVEQSYAKFKEEIEAYQKTITDKLEADIAEANAKLAEIKSASKPSATPAELVEA